MLEFKKYLEATIMKFKNNLAIYENISSNSNLNDCKSQFIKQNYLNINFKNTIKIKFKNKILNNDY